MAKNASLRKADGAKQDEFYTQLADIEKEMRHYKDQFKDKTIFCNCDDPYESNFFKYFALNFNHLGLKKLIATSYAGSPVAGEQLSFITNTDSVVEIEDKQPYKVEITEVTDENSDGSVDLSDVEFLLRNKQNVLTPLMGDGDFRSPECIELLKEADIVITNPPFSLFRQYIAQLMDYNKKFIIIGSKNVLTYKEILPLLKDNKMWLGYGFTNGNAYFRVPEKYTKNFVDGVYNEETGLVKFRNVGWYTNLDTTKRHEYLTLYKKYKESDYPRYDNYDAINVDKVTDIPYDYPGTMGVPITFMDKYNPDQFEIIDGIGRYSVLNNEETKKAGKYLSMVDGKAIYFRYIIKNKQVQDGGSK